MRKDSLSDQRLNYPLTRKTWHLQAWVKPRLSLITSLGPMQHLEMWQCKHPKSRWYGKGNTPIEAYEDWAWLHTCYGVHFYLTEDARQLRMGETGAKRKLQNLLDSL